MNRFYGKYRGTVANNVDPNRLGRLQVEVPSVLGASRLSWAMPCVPYAGKGVGFFALPPVGARIWVEFEGGDPDHPVWVGGFWDDPGDLPVSPPLPDTKVLATAETTLTLDDTPGRSGVTIATRAGMKVEIGPQGIAITDGRGATIRLEGPTTSINGTALEVT